MNVLRYTNSTIYMIVYLGITICIYIYIYIYEYYKILHNNILSQYYNMVQCKVKVGFLKQLVTFLLLSFFDPSYH